MPAPTFVKYPQNWPELGGRGNKMKYSNKNIMFMHECPSVINAMDHGQFSGALGFGSSLLGWFMVQG